jgi:hypothetical protein
VQFITNGPDIPDALLQAHEDGRVVFFCGAGISYPAGLPGFKGLVDEIYRLNGTTRKDIEHEAYKAERYDAVLDLLERRLPGQRLALRRALADALKPKLRRNGATDTHAALMCLARNRDGALRLVTTNFDRVFHVAAKRSGQVFQAHAAPMLPIPKNSRWNGLVYLHGLLPEKGDDTALNRLVVTSGDFGLAYLTERWAARFVSELFRNYVVCFVGYSINDPVLRYMMDALAADRMLGEVTPQAWALGDCEPGKETSKTVEWEAKGVAPILYPVPTGTHDHSALHQTLQAWAETYRDGVTGKERIVVAHALARPSASTRQDDFVGRMLWALSDPSGLPARRFAEFSPVPSLEWLLDAFAANRYGHTDLVRFGVPPRDTADPKLRFSLIHRPAPYPLAPPMRLVAGGIAATQWDDVMFQLARWLLRHLNDPRLVLWIAERGGELHEQWAWQIERRLDELAQLEREGRTSDLEDIRTHAPDAIPGPLMRALWRLLLGGRVKSPWREPDLYRWKSRLEREGLTAALRLEIRELLSPKVRLSKPIRWGEEPANTNEPTRLRQLVEWELVLAADHVHSSLRDVSGEHWRSALPALIDDLQLLVKDAMDLLRELGGADERADRSHWDLPSISPHWQNRGFRDWVSLIELLRDAWLAVLSTDSARAGRIAAGWLEHPYPVFKRLALFAASQDGCTAPEQWVDWLLADSGWWLWSVDTKREVLRLLVLQGRRLTPASKARLEAAVLHGPPREMYRDDLEPEQWSREIERPIWLRLAKLRSSGAVLGEAASQRLSELSDAHPRWQLASNESDEFNAWMSGTGAPDHDEYRNIEDAPRTRRELVSWLTKPIPEHTPFYEDTWREVCRTRFFHGLLALHDLADQGIWPEERWREALQVWSESAMLRRSWRFGAHLVQSMPDDVLEALLHSVTWWLQAASEGLDLWAQVLVDLSRRILGMALPHDSEERVDDGSLMSQPVTAAINHPVGHVTRALVNLWFLREPNDGDGLPEDIAPFFTEICESPASRFRHGRIILASRLVALYRVDADWTARRLLPFLDWERNRSEAAAMWQAFLWAPRLHVPLLIALKRPFLETARHTEALGDFAQAFASFLTFAALNRVTGYEVEDWRLALDLLPERALGDAAQALTQAQESAADQGASHWRERMKPFWFEAWPKSIQKMTDRVSEQFARLILATGEEFPSAFDVLKDWLREARHPDFLVNKLHESGFCRRYPEAALGFLHKIVGGNDWAPEDLPTCLDEIVREDGRLETDPRYVALREWCRRHGR